MKNLKPSLEHILPNLTPYAAAIEAERAGEFAKAADLYKRAGDGAGGHSHAARMYSKAHECRAKAAAPAADFRALLAELSAAVDAKGSVLLDDIGKTPWERACIRLQNAQDAARAALNPEA